MKTDFDMAKQIEYTDNSVIERGLEIHDEWTRNGDSSRKIVSVVERMIASVQAQKTGAAYIDALSCLFALDIRMKEKYHTLWQCIFSYFSSKQLPLHTGQGCCVFPLKIIVDNSSG